MAKAVIEAPVLTGPGRSLLLAVLGIHAVSFVAVALSALPGAAIGALLALITLSAWRAWRMPRRWLWQDERGWWLGNEEDWDGPWQLADGSRLWSGLAVLQLRRDSRREHCIICRDGIRRAEWQGLRRRLNLR